MRFLGTKLVPQKPRLIGRNIYVENINCYVPKPTFAPEAICWHRICGVRSVLFRSACEQVRPYDAVHYQVSLQYRWLASSSEKVSRSRLLKPDPSSRTQHIHSAQLTETLILLAFASKEFCTNSETICGRVVRICVERIRAWVGSSSLASWGLSAEYVPNSMWTFEAKQKCGWEACNLFRRPRASWCTSRTWFKSRRWATSLSLRIIIWPQLLTSTLGIGISSKNVLVLLDLPKSVDAVVFFLGSSQSMIAWNSLLLPPPEFYPGFILGRMHFLPANLRRIWYRDCPS